MKNIAEMTLEESIKQLEKTVEKLENNDISLDKSIEVFEQGVKLVARSRKLLDDYTKRITVLKKENGIIKEVETDYE